jgi:hypothetical protein
MIKKYLLYIFLLIDLTLLSQNQTQLQFKDFLINFEDSVAKLNAYPKGDPYFFTVEIGSFNDSINFSLKISNNWMYQGQTYFNSKYCLFVGDCCYLLEPSAFDSKVARKLGFQETNIALLERAKNFWGYGHHHAIEGYEDYFFLICDKVK